MLPKRMFAFFSYLIIVLVLLGACESKGTSSMAESADEDDPALIINTPQQDEAVTDTPPVTPTEAPTNTPTVTLTFTPTLTPTLDPLVAVIGTWSCPNCYRQQLIEFHDTGNGLQFLIYRANGELIEWIGPDACKNINIPYYDCSISLNAAGSLTIAYSQELAGGCYAHYEQDLRYTDEILIRERFEMWNYCGGKLTQNQDILANHGPWEDYIRTE